MNVALRLYEQLTEAGEDLTNKRVIADALEHPQKRYPRLRELPTRRHIREGKLRAGIENARLEFNAIDIKIAEIAAKPAQLVVADGILPTSPIYADPLRVSPKITSAFRYLSLLERVRVRDITREVIRDGVLKTAHSI